MKLKSVESLSICFGRASQQLAWNLILSADPFCFVSPEIESSLAVHCRFHCVENWNFIPFYDIALNTKCNSREFDITISVGARIAILHSRIVWIFHFHARRTDSTILHIICTRSSVHRRFVWTSKSLFLMSRAINKSDVLARTLVLRACMRRLLAVNWFETNNSYTHVVIYQFVVLANVGDKFRINHHHFECGARVRCASVRLHGDYVICHFLSPNIPASSWSTPC